MNDQDVVTWNQDPAHFQRRSRRDFLRVGAVGALGLSLGDVLRMEAQGAQKWYESKPGKAKCVIQIVLAGGQAAQESWDPKPDAPLEYRGPLGVVKTKIPGVHFGEMLPECAKIADKMTIIRSMTGKEADHNRASYTLQTGYRMSPALKHPSMGAVVSHEFGPNNNLPPYMAIPNISGQGGTGYLSAQYGAFGMGSDPFSSKFEVRNLSLSQSVDADRFTRRQDMREAVEKHFRTLDTDHAALDAMDEFYKRAYTLISSPEAQKAFDLKTEPKKMIERYGNSQAGMRLLLARRLVEAGTRFITVSVGGWDHHQRIKDAFSRQMPQLDQAFAALITDLEERGLLDSTLVFMSGEFGRTPKINKSAGRDHYAKVFSMAMAGGGLTQGNIYGRSDATSIEVESDPVTMPDALATIYQQMGIHAEKELMAPGARPMEIVNGGSIVDGIIG